MNRLEKAILDRLTAKSEHEYMWPRWPAAEEASIAAMELVKAAYDSSYGDLDYMIWYLEQDV